MNTLIKWLATAITLVGAVLTSFQYTPENIFVLNLASVVWLIWAIRIKENSLIAVNLGLLAIYALGLVF